MIAIPLVLSYFTDGLIYIVGETQKWRK